MREWKFQVEECQEGEEEEVFLVDATGSLEEFQEEGGVILVDATENLIDYQKEEEEGEVNLVDATGSLEECQEEDLEEQIFLWKMALNFKLSQEWQVQKPYFGKNISVEVNIDLGLETIIQVIADNGGSLIQEHIQLEHLLTEEK